MQRFYYNIFSEEPEIPLTRHFIHKDPCRVSSFETLEMLFRHVVVVVKLSGQSDKIM